MATSVLTGPVLVLNATYEAIHVTGTKRALILVLKGVASMEEAGEDQVHSMRLTMDVPSVIRLMEYRRIPMQIRAISRKNILLRDRHTCQFCGRRFAPGDLTLDHVVPRSQGGKSSWDNLVACCHRCNNRKGNRTPEEAGLKLLRKPRPHNLHPSRHLIRMLGQAQEKWRKYLYY